VRIIQRVPGTVQVGALNSGWRPADGAFAGLRLSRVVRYTGDFTPPQTPFELDADTTGLFDFDQDSAGRGVAPDGQPYAIPVTPGTLSEP
jgi:hypothetical protein